MMLEIRLKTVGKIVAGEDKGRFVEVLDDSHESGGFLIFTYDSLDRSGDVYDHWVESIVDVDLFFEELAWRIDWQAGSGGVDVAKGESE